MSAMQKTDLKFMRSDLKCIGAKLDEVSNKLEDMIHKLNRFAPPSPQPNEQDIYLKFLTLKQGKRTMAEFIIEFDNLRVKCGIREANENTIARFIGGLYRKIAYEVELKKPKTLDEVYKYALKVEKKRALAKMSNSKPCTTMEQSTKQGVSVAEIESPKTSVPPPPPPPPPMSFNMPPPPFPPMHQDEPPLPKHDLPPPSSPPPPKPQPHVEEKGGLFIELSKNDEVSDKKGRHKENDDRVASVEKENNGIMLEIFVVKGKLSSWGFLVWFSGEKLGVIIFKVGNFFRLRWENLKQVKMKGNRSFTN